MKPLIVILGPTASGKTTLAATLAATIGGEVISADSRQVYAGMDIGTGKDLDEYIVNGVHIPYHLIDIADPGYEYNLYEFQQDFLKAYESILNRQKSPILCGGSGMYIESVIRRFKLPRLEADRETEALMKEKSTEELIAFLKSLKKLHNTTDLGSRERIIKAIMLAIATSRATEHDREFPEIPSVIFGIRFDPDVLRKRISSRLDERLGSGMVDEVNRLLDKGVPRQRLRDYGLEYRYVTLYLDGDLSFEEMREKLSIAIHQFAKRQRTWFRGMERRGITINWIDGELSLSEKVNRIVAFFET